MEISPGGKNRVLVVDDDKSIRILYSRVLSSGGFEVQTAENGREAINLLSGFRPDLIILDLVMPEQEGIETLLQLHSKHPEIPVVAISGALGANEYLHVADLLGACETLPKPIKPEQLLKTVKSVLKN
jgi:DNA-binding NtrC family response regulator